MTDDKDQEYDDRVKDAPRIQLTRSKNRAHRLLQAYPAAEDEKEAWQLAAMDAINQHEDSTRPEVIFRSFRDLVTTHGGSVTVTLAGQDLIVADALRLYLDADQRMGIQQLHPTNEDTDE